MLYRTLGPHIVQPTYDALRWAQKAPIVKQLDGVNLLIESQASAITIFRKYYPPEVQLSRIQNREQGWYVANEVHAALDGFVPDYVEGFNEIAPTLATGLEQYADFTENFHWRCQELGLKVAGFGIPTGNMQEEDVVYLVGRGWCGVEAISWHGYFGNQGLTEDHALRHRRIHDWAGGLHPPFILTETGRDAVEGGPRGYRAGGISIEQYCQELSNLDQALVHDAEYVLGGVVFTTGPYPDWDDFNMDPCVDRILSLDPPSPTHNTRRRQLLLT